MIREKYIKYWVSGILILWLFTAIAPALNVLMSQSTDTALLVETLEEEPEGKKYTDKKDWFKISKSSKIKLNNYFPKASFTVVKALYNSPYQQVVVPPPKV